MSKLKSCPFCGGEAFVRIDVALNPTQARYNVGCDKNSYCHGWYGHSRYYNTEAEAAAAWNTRHLETCRWEYPQGVNGWLGYMICSGCGERFDECVTDVAHYCPSCGRKVVNE